MTTDLYGVGEMPPGLSLVFVVVVTALPLWSAILALTRARQRRRLAEQAAAMLEKDHPLREGPIVLSGVVEHAPEQDVAVRVDVTQAGSESESSGSWSYSWAEVDRKIVVKPFYLKLAGGTRVRVMAPPDVEVADALDKKVLISHHTRVLSAELVPGEKLHAQGHLQRGEHALPGREQGYRDVNYEWALVPDRGRMLLSSEPLGEGMAARMRFHRGAGYRALFLLAVFHVSLFGFHSRLLAADQPATILKREHSTSKDSDGDIHHEYHVTLRVPGGHREIEIADDDYDRATEGKVVAVRKGVDWKLGGGSTLWWLHGGAMLVFALGSWFTYRGLRIRTRPWFRRTVNHSGAGRLPGD